MRRATRLGALTTLVLLGLGLALASPPQSARSTDLPMTLTAPAGMLPIAIERAGPGTVTAYHAALTHSETLAAVPCLCGCQESLGHRNNLDCYVVGREANGTVIYSTHGVSCAVCQAITRIAVDGLRQGLSGPALRQLVLSHYGVAS